MAAPAAVDACSEQIDPGIPALPEQIASLRPDIPRESSGLRPRGGTRRRAIELAKTGGKMVALVSEAWGIYAMAGLVLKCWRRIYLRTSMKCCRVFRR